ncbi:MAG: carbohydrate ABC transporter substrate-binding protein [Firmicutes bacterium]|nr:carbohydrate ABC transporter substrate-binding protein [Bacillota bacterium]
MYRNKGISRFAWLLLTVALIMAATSVTTWAAPKETVTVLGVWGGQELQAFNKVLAAFEKKTGIHVEFTGTRDTVAVLVTRLQAGNPPDIAALATPGLIWELASKGQLVDLGKVLNMSQMKKDYAQTWLDLGSYKGKLYAIFFSVDLKSLVWYSPKAFAAHGYKIPQTWNEMLALTKNMAASGVAPWSIGLESGAASGWPGTDWIEDIMLRTGGPEVYDKWVNHEISWTSEPVRRAFELFGEIARNAHYVYGGPTAELSINFGDAVKPVFADPPKAYMLKQATFIQSFIRQAYPNLQPVKDYSFFAFPAIDPKWGVPVEVAGDGFEMLRDTPAARKLMQFLASPEAQEIWVHELGKLSVNKRVPLSAYPDELSRKAAEIVLQAKVARFDASDLMPAALGSDAFWKGVLNYVSGQDLDSVLNNLEAVAKKAYGSK